MPPPPHLKTLLHMIITNEFQFTCRAHYLSFMIRLDSGQSTNLIIKHSAICIVSKSNVVCKQFIHTKHESDQQNHAVCSKVSHVFLSKAILNALLRKISSLNLREPSYALNMVKTTKRNSNPQIPERPASKAHFKNVSDFNCFIKY